MRAYAEVIPSDNGTWVDRVLAAHADSDRPAVGATTGRELVAWAAGAADLLPPGPVPALLTTNATSVALLLGGARTGSPLAPLGPRLTVDELAGPVRDLGSPVLLTEPAFADHARAVAAAAGVTAVVVDGVPAAAAFRGDPGEVGLVLHTAGTTGRPKRVDLTQRVLDARADVLVEVTGLDATKTYATGSPFHHVGGIGTFLAALTVGAGTVATDRFTLDWWAGLGAVTHCLLVPTMIEMLLAAGTLDRVPLETLVYGAAPMSPQTLRRVMATLPGVALVNLFGQTEGSPLTVLTKADHVRALTDEGLLTSVGRAAPGLTVRVHEPDPDGVGEVHARGPHLSVVDDDGWLHSGDLGTIDADGYVRLTGRLHDKVVRGGETVYPVEVEQVLLAHPHVRQAAVVGVPDARLGETLVAYVDADLSDAELHAHVRSRLAGFKVPAAWYRVDALPLTHAGKLDRRALRTADEEAS